MTIYYSHICTRCKTPQLVASEGNIEHAFLRVSGVMVLVVVWLYVAYLVGAFAGLVALLVCGWLAYYLIRSQKTANLRRRRICSACASDSLVPITTPEGERLCAEINLHPDDAANTSLKF